ncbi:MAG: YihY/virulence factor BrkB family protein [Thermoflexales bacterium]
MKDRLLARAKPVLEFLGKVMAEFSSDGAPRMAAAMAYYTIFSLAPLLVVVVAVIGLIVGQQTAQTQLVGQLAAQVGQESAELVANLVARAFNPASSIIALLIGVLGVLGGASTVVLELRAALNNIWDVKAPPAKGITGFLLSIVKPWFLVLIVGAVMVASTVLSTVLTRASGELMRIAPALSIIGGVSDVVISLLVTTLAFAMALKVLPLVKLEWRDVWVGAFVTAVLFGAGKYLLTWYLGTSGVGSPYGAAGSLVLLLVWVFYSAQIFLLGAEFTQVFARTLGTRRRERALLADPPDQERVVPTEKRNVHQ